MTAAEIVMKRDDPNIAWGFRLTGGSDLGTPFYVVKQTNATRRQLVGARNPYLNRLNRALWRNQLSSGNRVKQRRAWLLLGLVTTERSCLCKQSTYPAIGGHLEFIFKLLVQRLSDSLALNFAQTIWVVLPSTQYSRKSSQHSMPLSLGKKTNLVTSIGSFLQELPIVLGRGHAERAGLRVGDMVYAINHKYINTFSHKDAQNAIVHTGDTLILNIKRGPHGGRGTPLPDYVDPLMGIAPPPPTERPKPVPLPPYEPPPPIVKEPTPPPESDEEEETEETVAAFNVKINPKGRIAAIEELPVTPPPSRSSSRCRSRSRSASRDRRGSSKRASQVRENGVGARGMSGPGEAFTYSKEVITQYSTVLSASNQSGGETAQTINESFIIHGGSEHKMEGE
ncbi:hypothetical protein J6590_091666 [Homalodisca vitripennis]|nr:hypothetical protein J6590_081976 [Homalodisca vitripennis]KAG8284943.1 hypothetical protein J6590_091666 [Homalodisca vitripennis]